MIDTKSLREHIRFTIEYYGTHTQGDEHRYDQIADCLTETFIRLIDADAALKQAMSQYSGPHCAIFKINVS